MTTPTLTRTRITTPTQWAVQVLVDMNKKLPKNQQIPINVKNVETILRPIPRRPRRTHQLDAVSEHLPHAVPDAGSRSAGGSGIHADVR